MSVETSHFILDRQEGPGYGFNLTKPKTNLSVIEWVAGGERSVAPSECFNRLADHAPPMAVVVGC